METVTIRFSLGGREAEALKRWAYTELRTPRDQARYLLCQELARRKMLQVQDDQDTDEGEARLCQK